LANLVAGKNVEIEYNKRDRYGRIIGKQIKDGQDIRTTYQVEPKQLIDSMELISPYSQDFKLKWPVLSGKLSF